MMRFIAIAVALLCSAPLALPASAQSLWMPRDKERAVLIEVLKPSFDLVDEEFATGAMFVGYRSAPQAGASIVIEGSFARFGFESASSFTLGNPYLGVEHAFSSSPLFMEVGVRAPLASVSEDDALAAGLVSDVARWQAFFPKTVPISVALNLRRVSSEGVVYRLRLAPVFTIPTQRYYGDPELWVVYSAQLGLERSAVRAGAGFVGRTITTHDYGSFSDRTETQADLHLDFGSGTARPGVDVKIPLGDLNDAVPVVVGVSLGFSF